MDILLAQFIQPPQGPADLVPSTGAGLGPVDAGASARFNEVMASQPAPAAVGPDDPAPVQPSGAPPTMGDDILAGLRNLSADFRQSWTTVHAVLDGGAPTRMGDLMKLQLGLTQMSIQYDLVGKAIGRSTQNLDQLVKLQ